MSVVGHKRKSRTTILMSVMPPKAEVARVRVYAISSRLGFTSFTIRDAVVVAHCGRIRYSEKLIVFVPTRRAISDESLC